MGTKLLAVIALLLAVQVGLSTTMLVRSASREKTKAEHARKLKLERANEILKYKASSSVGEKLVDQSDQAKAIRAEIESALSGQD
jgi:hypothetical protein